MAAARTLLELTSEILEQMQSDEVTAITDTAESKAVASIIRRTYWDLFGLMDLPEHYTLFRLTESSASTPTLMTIPTNCMKVVWIKYNRETLDDTDDTWVDLRQLPIKEAVDRSDTLRQSNDSVSSFSTTYNPLGTDAISWYYINDMAPTWFTSPDDSTFLFDAVDTGVEAFLRTAKTKAWGIIDPAWTHSGSFTPDLDPSQFSMLYNEAKAQCFIDLKQTVNAKAESRARRLQINAQHKKVRTPDFSPLDRLPNYGRK